MSLTMRRAGRFSVPGLGRWHPGLRLQASSVRPAGQASAPAAAAALPGQALGVEMARFSLVEDGSAACDGTVADGASAPAGPDFAKGRAGSDSGHGSVQAGAESAGLLSRDNADGALGASPDGPPRRILSALLRTPGQRRRSGHRRQARRQRGVPAGAAGRHRPHPVAHRRSGRRQQRLPRRFSVPRRCRHARRRQFRHTGQPVRWRVVREGPLLRLRSGAGTRPVGAVCRGTGQRPRAMRRGACALRDRPPPPGATSWPGAPAAGAIRTAHGQAIQARARHPHTA